MYFDVLIGKKIVKVTDNGRLPADGNVYQLHCSDGTVILVKENLGCGGCANGWSEFSEIKKLADVDNVITDVKYEKVDERYGDEAQLFVFYERPEFNQTLNADEGWGNGYYGGGFYISILGME